MALFLTDFDQWYEEFEAASPRQQYELFKAAIATPLPPGYAKETDFGVILLDVWGLLLGNNQIEAALAFVKTLQQQQPEVYQAEFQYLDDILVMYALFQEDEAAVREALDRFKAHPIQAIDSLMAVLDDLAFYQAIDPLDELCRAIYQPVATSTELLGGSEIEISNAIIFNQFDQVYQQHRQGQTVDWQALKAEGVKFGFLDKDSLWAEIQDHITRPLTVDKNFENEFKNNQGMVLRHILMEFCRTMRDQHGMSFVCSSLLWQTILDALDAQEVPKKQRQVPDGYFAVQKPKLDRYLAQQIGGFLSMRQSRGVAMVWGLPLLYEFLLERGIVSERIAQKAISIVNEFKPQIIKGFDQSLWQYDFVHRWPRPDCVSEEEFTAEVDHFRASITQSTPLSDEPTPKRSVRSWETRAQPTSGLPKNSAQPAALPTEPKRSWKMPKPRKSPLQEAKDLGKAKSQKSKQKKTGKGFN